MISEKLEKIILTLKRGGIISYPTESVFALGCDPDNIQTLYKLLLLKNRSWKKGFILIGGHYKQFNKYIDKKKINKNKKKILLSQYTHPITWVVPAKKNISKLLIGKFNSLAIRMINFNLIKKLCLLYGKPLISTSANINGLSPCKTKEDVKKQFNNQVHILNGSIIGNKKPSEIRDLLTGKIYRKG
ncbi:MAG: Sua5/YciO/YrdC/YwlC family protein [Arsenophonus sp.]|nr:MAG: Sua5/YciO/YrdC/YwlC family protein [Arsenophonus sp.]